MVADERARTMRWSLKRLSAPFGRVRNLDVFLSPKGHKTSLAALEDLQDGLGDLNDIVTGRELAGTEAGKGSALFAADMTKADIEARTRKLVASSAEAHQTLIDIRPFWR